MKTNSLISVQTEKLDHVHPLHRFQALRKNTPLVALVQSTLKVISSTLYTQTTMLDSLQSKEESLLVMTSRASSRPPSRHPASLTQSSQQKFSRSMMMKFSPTSTIMSIQMSMMTPIPIPSITQSLTPPLNATLSVQTMTSMKIHWNVLNLETRSISCLSESMEKCTTYSRSQLEQTCTLRPEIWSPKKLPFMKPPSAKLPFMKPPSAKLPFMN